MIHRISRLKSWRGVNVDVIERFRAAAGITFATEAAQARYLARTIRTSARPLRHVHLLGKKDKLNLISASS